MVAIFERIQHAVDMALERYDHAVATARKRSGTFDNFWAAKERYSEVMGGRLAAAIAYYGFFAAFALSLVAFSVFGFFLESHPHLQDTVTTALEKNLPSLPVESIQNNAANIAFFGVIGLLLTGLGWVDCWRTSQRAVWKLEEHPGNVVIRRLVDLGMLIALAAVMGFSLVLGDLLDSLFRWLSGGTSSIWLTLSTGGVTVLINVMFAAALLTALPRLHIQPRRLIPPAVAVGLTLSLLNWLGRAYVTHATRFYTAYAVIATAAGLLIYLYLFNQVVLWGAALAATSTRGRFIDLAAGPKPEADQEPEQPEQAGSPADGATGSPGT
ncbi:YihY/virulence factor BrkB family protein [Hamadaea tsunoensis]|uniref:YihY/virulence factor BrkB family protein n=1 Tax=Hamadaea tsunoensis TaxID=53368 RepID=UPI0004275E5D|nr:YihY/virulence factor BrkB family protein [Hamadaea tsunoensis]